MKIMIVDDEVVSRMKMKKIMDSVGECEVFESGIESIKTFKQALEDADPFDVITLDVTMPGIDGTEVLVQMREIETEMKIPQEKKVKVLMVTSQADKDTVTACIQAGCDGYIAKPFDKELMHAKLMKIGLIVTGKIERTESIREIIMDTVQRFEKGKIELPILPNVVMEIQDAMNKQICTIDDLEQIIEKDAVISAKLISTANSPAYPGAEKIHSVAKALIRIGLKECQNIVSVFANKRMYETKDKQFKKFMEKNWLHSLACAHCAKAISKKIKVGDIEQLFMMGLTHDIGKVLLLKALEKTSLRTRSIDKKEMLESIQEVHTSFGAAILEKWCFSNEFVKIARLHEFTKFDLETEKEILIINLANNMARKIGYSFFDGDEIILEELESAKILEIGTESMYE
ncbi:MAG: HDOD domain-containing protein, partial [Deltaproteobacteria bacterium]|nr:HDOD domain-containing protein [Deltaproteobacteria bacterium]